MSSSTTPRTRDKCWFAKVCWSLADIGRYLNYDAKFLSKPPVWVRNFISVTLIWFFASRQYSTHQQRAPKLFEKRLMYILRLQSMKDCMYYVDRYLKGHQIISWRVHKIWSEKNGLTFYAGMYQQLFYLCY